MNWGPEHFSLGADIEWSRKAVERAMEERRKLIEIAKARQTQTLTKFRKIRESVKASDGDNKWILNALSEAESLRRIEEDIKEDIMKQKGRAHRAKQNIMWSMAPNGYAKLRGKWKKGASLGEGPLPFTATTNLKDPRVESAYNKYYWDDMGRRHRIEKVKIRNVLLII